MPDKKPLMIQCDFDGTVTYGDLSFDILDKYTNVPWRTWFREYTEGKMTVNEYNLKAFSYIKASPEELDKYSRDTIRLRPGLVELIDFCHANNIRFYFVSNGMDFYIRAIINKLGLKDIEFASAVTNITENGIEACYPDPDGKILTNDFKISYTRRFLEQGYRVVYMGNGLSDFAAARHCQYIYAIETLAKECDKHGVPYKSFTTLDEIADDLKELL
jgi:2-hydroxy-3-keto-5-methylthiopentenyl-1-phosphate phosphatase